MWTPGAWRLYNVPPEVSRVGVRVSETPTKWAVLRGQLPGLPVSTLQGRSGPSVTSSKQAQSSVGRWAGGAGGQCRDETEGCFSLRTTVPNLL